jgi:hypothetical protein
MNYGEGTPVMRINIEVKLLLNQKNCILNAKRITVEIDKIEENIRLKIWNNTEEHTQGMNDDKMDTNDKEHQKKDHVSNNSGLGRIENNKHPGPEREQHMVRNKVKEDLQITWHKVKLLQIMSGRERLPKLKENSKLIKLMEEINGTAELLEDESDITDINYLIHVAATIMTQKMNQPSKRSKNRKK